MAAVSQSFLGSQQQQPQQPQPWNSAPTLPTLTLPSLDTAAALPGPPLSVHSVALLQLLRFWVSKNAQLMAACLDPHSSSLTAAQTAVQTQQLERLALFIWRGIKGGEGYVQPNKADFVRSLSLRLDHRDVLGVLAWFDASMRSVVSPDSIDDLFSVELPKLLLRFVAVRDQADEDTSVLPAVDMSSAFGLFIRHQQLLYRCASFDEVGRLYEQTVLYVTAEGNGELSTSPSTAQVLAFVHSEAAAVQLSIGRRSHVEMARLCEEVAAAAAGTAPAAAAFLSYVTALGCCDYEEAARQLHRFADLSSSLDTTTINGAHTGDDKSSRSRMRNGLLNLALLHARFGHTDLCVELLDECIRLCQSSQDTHTLQQALSILVSLTRDQPTSTKAISLYQRSVDAQLVSAELAVQSVDRWRSEQGIGAAPQLDELQGVHAQTFLLAAQAELMRPLSSPPNGTASSSSITPAAVWSNLASSASISSVYDLQQCLQVDRQLRSQAWQLFGSRHLASLWAEVNYRTDATATTAEHSLSSLHALATDPQRSVEEQAGLLSFAHNEFPHLSHLPMVDLAHFIHFRLALQRSDLATASLYASAIAQLSAAVSNTAPFAFEQLTEARIACLQLHWERGRRRAAWDECSSLIVECKARRHVGLTIRTLLIQAEMYMQTSDEEEAPVLPTTSTAQAPRSTMDCEFGSRVLSGCCRAWPILVEASKLCERAAADVQAAAVDILMARCYIALGRAADGLKAIRRVLPLVLEHSGVQLLVDALHALALCYLAVELEADEDDAENLKEAADVLRVALEAAHSLQWKRRCVQLSYLYARVCHELGWLEERERAAQHFITYSQQHGYNATRHSHSGSVAMVT